MQKQIVLSYLIPYLKLKQIPYKKSGKVTMIKCIFCDRELLTANLIPNTYTINAFCCNKKYNLIDIAKKVENLTGTEDDIIHHLKELLKINVITKKDENKIEETLKYYQENGFDLVPITSKSKKLPIGNSNKVPIENDWTNKEHKDIEEWKRWIYVNELNIGIKMGIKSNLLSLDIDALTKEEKEEFYKGNISLERQKELKKKRIENIDKVLKILQPMIGKTLTQETLGGLHLCYKYDKEIPKTHIEIEGIHIDVESEGGYILAFPSKIGNIGREWKELIPIIEMPKDLKDFLLSKITTPKKTVSEDIKEAIETENFKIDSTKFNLKNNQLEGCCNSEFIKLGGILRKKLSVSQTEYALYILNKHMLEHPMDSKAINAMMRELEKYQTFDEKKLAQEILEHLQDMEQLTRNEIANAIVGTTKGEDKKRVDKTLAYLVKEGHLANNKNIYKIVKEMNWTDNILDIGIPIDFVVPYLNDVCYFNKGDLIIIGSRNKFGKTTIAMNIVKRLINQGIKPYYIYNETGGRFAKTALQLGMVDGAFFKIFCSDPDKVILKPNAVTIYDWVKPVEFARTDNLFNDFVEKLEKTKGFMICFVQLRDSNGWFAPDQIGQFPTLLGKYLYDKDDSGEFGYFKIELTRDPKLQFKQKQIPCQYNWETKELKTIEEIQKEEEKK